MIWATVSYRSCFCWLYAVAPSSATKNVLSLISVLIIRCCLCVKSISYCWKTVHAMTSVFPWQNSVSLWLISLCTPRAKLAVTPGVSWCLTFSFQSPMMNRISFLGVSSRRSYRSSQNWSTSASLASVVGASVVGLNYCDHNKLWKTLKETRIPDHLICLLRNLYASLEARIRTLYGMNN